jgi:hypothetical protein
VWVDLRLKTNSATFAVDWRLETAADTYTDQASATLASAAGNMVGRVYLAGSTATQTMTVDFDNVCLSSHYVVYPLGPHEVRLLTVDPAGTPTLSGTSTNFSVFTANGTLAAWNATNARNAVDEVPPTISAAADGICQTAVAATDYIEFPMAAATLAADEIVSGVRMLTPMWGGTGTGTGTFGVRGWDGTAETTLVAAGTSYDAGSPTAVSTTEPRWECAMWPAPTGWTKTAVDALALRVGFSTDATPDMGCHATYLEYATRKAVVHQLFGDLASQAENPNTVGIRSVTVDTNVTPGKTADLHYETSGSPTDVPVAADTEHVEAIDAPDMATVNRIELHQDPEP